MKAFITATGASLPPRIVPNEEIAATLGLTPERIYKSSGIRRRRWAKPGTRTSTLAAQALHCALATNGIDPDEIDFLLLGTMTPDRFIPGSAPAIQKQLALPQIPCLDIRATCCNAVYGLQLARSLVLTSAARRVALCLADIQSPWLEMSKHVGTTSMLFGDGASALIVSGVERNGALEIIDVILRTDGSFIDDLGVRSPGTEFGSVHGRLDPIGPDHLPRMNGKVVLLRASRNMAAACRALLQRNNITEPHISWVVPHQANINVVKQLLRALGLARHPERLVSVIEDLGNTSSASMGIALDHLCRSGNLKSGEYVLMPAFGAGFTWGAALCRVV